MFHIQQKYGQNGCTRTLQNHILYNRLFIYNTMFPKITNCMFCCYLEFMFNVRQNIVNVDWTLFLKHYTALVLYILYSNCYNILSDLDERSIWNKILSIRFLCSVYKTKIPKRTGFSVYNQIFSKKPVCSVLNKILSRMDCMFCLNKIWPIRTVCLINN